MASAALVQWRTVGLARLDELEAVHAGLTGTAPGRRWGTAQLNRQLFVALVAYFQEYCREVHNEAVAVHSDTAVPGQAGVISKLLTERRKLDTQNPRRGTSAKTSVGSGSSSSPS